MTMGFVTPNINEGCPPSIECMIPQIIVEAKVCTVLNLPFTQNKHNFSKW